MTLTMYNENGKSDYREAQSDTVTEKPITRITDVIPGLMHALAEFTGRTNELRNSLGRIGGQRHSLTPRPGRAPIDLLLEENEKENGSHMDLIAKLTEALLVVSTEVTELAEAANYLASGSVHGDTKGNAMIVSRKA